MSNENKGKKVIHVDNLVIHAKEVKVIQEHNQHERHHEHERRDPWGFFWGGSRRGQDHQGSEHAEQHEEHE